MLILIQAVRYFFQFIQLLIIVRIVLSWVPNVNMYSPPVRFIYDATEPIMKPVRELMFRLINTGPIDFSPIIVFFLLQVVESAIIRILFMIR